MQRRTNGTWSGRAMAFGTTGVTAAITLLMVLSPAGGALAPMKVYAPPYKGTVSQPNGFNDFGGCAKSKITAPAWHALTGVITTNLAASAKTCGKSLGYVGGSSFTYTSTGIEVGLPFSVGASGNHSIQSNWAINIASAWSFAASSVCNKNINYNPPLYSYSYSYCEAGTDVSFEVAGSVFDLNNNSWYSHNYSYAYAYNDTFFENYTDCYNYGTPTCYNATGGSFMGSFGYNEAGMSSFVWNGATSVSLWNNGTNMVKGHHYVLVLSIYASVDAFAQSANLLSAWSGSASATMNLGTLGNGVTVSSFTVL